jgi:hypothetical protein
MLVLGIARMNGGCMETIYGCPGICPALMCSRGQIYWCSCETSKQAARMKLCNNVEKKEILRQEIITWITVETAEQVVTISTTFHHFRPFLSNIFHILIRTKKSHDHFYWHMRTLEIILLTFGKMKWNDKTAGTQKPLNYFLLTGSKSWSNTRLCFIYIDRGGMHLQQHYKRLIFFACLLLEYIS